MFPILYQSHDLILYSYPLMMGLGWGVGYQIFFHHTDLDFKKSQLLFWGLFLSSWVGAKLLFLINSQEAVSSLVQEFSFWTGGGFVFYGGLLLASVFVSLWIKLGQGFTEKTLWALLLSLSMGHALGRLGCWLAGCCYGALTDRWWGLEMHGGHRHPTQLIEALGLLILFGVIKKVGPKLLSLFLYLLYYGSLRLVVESLRGDALRGLWGPLTPSQWLSLLIIFGGLALFWKTQRKLFR